MVGIKNRDVDKGILMVFMLCYEYSMSFTNLLKLFKISRKYFWTFMEICSPMLKMGIRKASMIRKSVDKIIPYITDEGIKEELTVHEENVLDTFSWFLIDSFSDGTSCFHLSQIEQFPFAKAYIENGLCVASSFEGIKNNLDQIEYIDIGGNKFYKTSRFAYYMEKFCGDLSIHQIDNMSIKEMLNKIDEGERKLMETESNESKKELCTR